MSGFFDSFLGGLFGVADSAMRTNMDWGINQANLDYQRERNEIEDARYVDETAYNRAFAEDERAYNRAFAEDERNYQRQFAEDERAYNRALQQQIFEREDTALERQASSLSKMGINPLSQSMNGLGPGQALTSSAPTPSTSPSATVPSASSHSGQALHNDMKSISFLSPILSFLDTANGLKTGEYQRDLLKSQRDKQILDNQAQEISNLIYMEKYGVKIDDNGLMTIPSFKHKEQDFSDVDYDDKSASRNRNVREDYIQNKYGSHDLSSTVDRIATDTAHHADDSKTYITNLTKDVTESVIKVLSGMVDNKVNEFKENLKNGFNNDISRVKSRYQKIKDWFKRNTASSSELQSYSGR